MCSNRFNLFEIRMAAVSDAYLCFNRKSFAFIQRHYPKPRGNFKNKTV